VRSGRTALVFGWTAAPAAGALVIDAKPPGDSHVIARLTASTTRGGVPLTVRFDAGASCAATGAALAFAWDFGDGSTTAMLPAGDVVEHTYTRTGTFMARVTVSDGMQQATADVVISVEGQGFPDAPGGPSDDDTDHQEHWDVTESEPFCLGPLRIVEVSLAMR